MKRNRWTSAEMERLSRMDGQSLAEVAEAFPLHTRSSVKSKRAELSRGSKPLSNKAKRWLRICDAHKPRIILATPFPAERTGTGRNRPLAEPKQASPPCMVREG